MILCKHISWYKIEACNDGEYGMNCLFNCSTHCLDGEVCNKADVVVGPVQMDMKEINVTKVCFILNLTLLIQTANTCSLLSKN